ncbi:MAG: RNA polymerase sigma factor [Bacteroidota bacterium]|nr:RNA polymerase sigma factor [Bacteroidota bacterium]
MNENDLLLARKCLDGDRDAQQKLFNLYSGLLMGICRRYINNNAEAGDAFQEGFIKIFNNLHNYKGNATLKTWSHSIMTNNAIDFLRKQRTKNVFIQITTEFEETYSDKYNNEEHEEISFTSDEAIGLLDQLPDQYRTCLNLFAVDGYTHAEISALLGISESSSRSNVARARQLLKKKMK